MSSTRLRELVIVSFHLRRVLAMAGVVTVTSCAGHHPTTGAMRGHAMRAESLESLAGAIRGRVAGVPGAVAGVYYRALDDPADTLVLGGDSSFHAASTMKIAVMIQVYRDAESGRIALGQAITLRNQFASIVDGSPYALDP